MYSQDIIIAGVGHGYPGSNDGYIEVYVKNTIEFGQFYVKSYSDYDGSLKGYVTLFAPLSAGTSYYFTSDDAVDFNSFFGFNPNSAVEQVGFINGDDTITIEADDFSTIIDIYGEIGVDGTGLDWDYSRGWAYRLDGYGPNTTFTISEWNIHVSAFLSCPGSTNVSCTTPYPAGSYTLSSNSKELAKLKLLPNPTNKGYVQILSNNPAYLNVQVFDILGKQISETKLNGNRLDVSSLKTGVYFLKITQDHNYVTKKLIIN